ncbi:MAG TPA: ATPase, T2SS/T4P/T4SS family [Armatimonadota bacterium]
MSDLRRSRAGDIFVREGYVTDAQVDQAVEKQLQTKTQAPIGEILVAMGFISERDKVRCLSKHFDVEYVDLADIRIDDEAAKLITGELARKYKIVPIGFRNGRVRVASKVPPDPFVMDEIRALTGLEVEPAVATMDDLLSAIDIQYQSSDQIDSALSGLLRDMEGGRVNFEESSSDDSVTLDELEKMSGEAPIIRLASLIIQGALQEKASDIHVEPGKDRVKVRYRVDGVLHDAMVIPKAQQSSLISRLKVMSQLDIANKRSPQDGRIGSTFEGKEYDFRVSTLPGVWGEKVVMRVLDKTSLSLGLNKLGLLPHNLERFENCINRPHGIVLVTGPTGSGKSTTLYSALHALKTPERNIITVEDPVEYNIEGLTQVMKNDAAGLTFPAALRSILRQDPDIIMIGEIRDGETATIACEAALTGHLVLSTLHTNDAPSAITRLIDLGIEPFLISSAVAGVLAQRLVRKICDGDDCKVPYQPPAQTAERLGFDTSDGRPVTLFKGQGCPKCRGTGYKGRMGVHEMMVMDDELRSLTMGEVSSATLMEAAIKGGMKTLRDDVLDKILLGLTDFNEALRVIYAG